MRVKLSESKLKSIIKSAVKTVLSEGALSQKDIENRNSWDTLQHDYDNGSNTYYRPIGKYDNGYNSEYIQPGEELEMYQSMGNPSQYATKGEFPKRNRNSDGYGWHRTPLRYDDGDLSIAAQSTPMTSRDVYGDDDDTEVNIRYKDSEGGTKLAPKATYARDPRNFMGNQDMHDLESDRIAQANADAAAEGDYMRQMGGLYETIRKIVNKTLNEIGDTQRGQYALGCVAARNDMRQRNAYKNGNYDASRKFSNTSDAANKVASQSRASVNGGNEFNQENLKTYDKAKNMYNANQQGYRNYMSSQMSPSAEDYRTAKIRH